MDDVKIKTDGIINDNVIGQNIFLMDIFNNISANPKFYKKNKKFTCKFSDGGKIASVDSDEIHLSYLYFMKYRWKLEYFEIKKKTNAYFLGKYIGLDSKEILKKYPNPVNYIEQKEGENFMYYKNGDCNIDFLFQDDRVIKICFTDDRIDLSLFDDNFYNKTKNLQHKSSWWTVLGVILFVIIWILLYKCTSVTIAGSKIKLFRDDMPVMSGSHSEMQEELRKKSMYYGGTILNNVSISTPYGNLDIPRKSEISIER
jgi:hypothetical protein